MDNSCYHNTPTLTLPAEIMSCRKFLTITNVLHLSDPQDDEENKKKKEENSSL